MPRFPLAPGLIALILAHGALAAEPSFSHTSQMAGTMLAQATQDTGPAGPDVDGADQSDGASGHSMRPMPETGNPVLPVQVAEPGQSLEEPEEPLPEILTDLEAIPFPVRKMRELLLAAAYSGDIEKLRPYIGYGDDVTMLSLGGLDEDPIQFLKTVSGDPEGQEILAILTEILEAPFVHQDAGTERELYVWPYFYAYPFQKLTPEQRVGLFRIITYGDYEEMASFGGYIFYRVGITPEGRWRFFVAGD